MTCAFTLKAKQKNISVFFKIKSKNPGRARQWFRAISIPASLSNTGGFYLSWGKGQTTAPGKLKIKLHLVAKSYWKKWPKGQLFGIPFVTFTHGETTANVWVRPRVVDPEWNHSGASHKVREVFTSASSDEYTRKWFRYGTVRGTAPLTTWHHAVGTCY